MIKLHAQRRVRDAWERASPPQTVRAALTAYGFPFKSG